LRSLADPMNRTSKKAVRMNEIDRAKFLYRLFVKIEPLRSSGPLSRLYPSFRREAKKRAVSVARATFYRLHSRWSQTRSYASLVRSWKPGQRRISDAEIAKIEERAITERVTINRACEHVEPSFSKRTAYRRSHRKLLIKKLARNEQERAKILSKLDPSSTGSNTEGRA